MLELEWVITFLVLGSVVGFVAGLLGVGGGGILVPILTVIFLKQGVVVDQVLHLALGTSMACIIITSFASLRAQHKKQTVIWNIVKVMSLPIIIGTLFATFLVPFLNVLYLAIFFTLFMLMVALKLLKKPKPKPKPKPKLKLKTEIEMLRVKSKKSGMIIYAFIIGVISALVSIGGGSLTVPYLVSRNIAIKQAIGTSAAIGLPIALAGTLGYLINGWFVSVITADTIGFVNIPAFIFISLSSFLSAPLGVKASHNLPVNLLKKLFAVLLIIMSVKMLLSII
ncbi:MAG: sulfite exporter TauE/SafE family protein [Saccharospirillaceae bacterium]|nr:sulfite exporter TauE/SafE family protein [Pseudomonadales bacterium]NRB79792.1 sulfite exporter TauE/SafE family protein [Saccharospirillaceae bacterium]